MQTYRIIYSVLDKPNGNYSPGGMNGLVEEIQARDEYTVRRMIEARYGGPAMVVISGVMLVR